MNKVSLGDISRTTQYAWSLVGIPYKLGGNVPQDGGMDCSAYVLELLRSLGAWGSSDSTAQDIFRMFNTRANTRVEYQVFVHITKEFILHEGDFLFFGRDTSSITHCAYAIDSSRMLEAGGTDTSGMIRLRKTRHWRTDLIAVVRFI